MSDEATEAMQALAAPGPEHERLESFVGVFRAVVKLWMGPGDPMVSTGTMTNTLELGDRFLRQDYKGDPGPGPFPDFEGHGYWGFNKATQQYEGFWIDTASTLMQTEAGTVDDAGKMWTMLGEMMHQPGETVKKRTVITLEDEDNHSMVTYFVKGDEEFKGMEIQYTRAE